MFKSAFIAILAGLALSGCMSAKLGDVLPNPGAAIKAPVPITIGVTAIKTNPYNHKTERNKDLEQAAAKVFSEYGWSVTDNENAPIAVCLDSNNSDFYFSPLFFLLYEITLGIIPATNETYTNVTATVKVDGIEQESIGYTANFTGYMSLTSPIGLLIPGATIYGGTEVGEEALNLALRHIAEDLRSKYASDNFQATAI